MDSDEKNELSKAREYVVVKDNKLIQNVTRRKYELSVIEQKALGFILSMIKPPEETAGVPEYKYTFDIRLFCKICGIDYNSGTNYKNVKEALQRLAGNSFWIDEGESQLLFQWIVTPRIYKKSGKVTIRISEEVMPYLFDLKERFTRYELYQILALRGAYSIAIYELLKSHAFKRKITIYIDDLKSYLSIKNKYNDYRNLRRRVIEPSMKEINLYTDLRISCEAKKKGKECIALEFVIDYKKNWDSYLAYKTTMEKLQVKE